MPADDAITRWTKASNGGAFRAIRWALALPTLRTGRGHLDDKLRLVAFVLAAHADGETGENSFPGLDRIAREAGLSGKKEVAEVLARGEELGLWESEEDASEWGTTAWHMNLGDAELFVRLEKMELERSERKRQQKSDQWSRYKDRQGQSGGPAADNSEDGVTAAIDGEIPRSDPKSGKPATAKPGSGRRVSALALQGHFTGTAGSEDRHCRGSAPVLQGLPSPTNQPLVPALGDLPSSPALAARPTPPSASPSGDQLPAPVPRKATERAWVRGLVAAFAAGLVSDEDLEELAALEVQPHRNETLAYDARVVRIDHQEKP